MWDYKNTDIKKIRQSLLSVNWDRNIRNKNPNNHVNFLTNCIINSFRNFCPNKIITCQYKDAPWITFEIKQKLKEKTKIYKLNMLKITILPYTRNCLTINKILENSNLIKITEERYCSEPGRKYLNHHIGPKKYCSILNTFLGKKKMPSLPPLFENGEIVSDYAKKAEIFNEYFGSQYSPFTNESELPLFRLGTTFNTLSTVFISHQKIIDINIPQSK